MLTQISFLILALFLVLLNAFFVAAEFGMVKLRATRVDAIKNNYGVRGRILNEVHAKLDAYLSACQLGITLASLGLGWVGEPAFAKLIESAISWSRYLTPETIKVIAFVLAFSLISFLHIVIGELMPKSLAIRKAEIISIWTAIPLYLFYWLMYPAIFILNKCSNYFLSKAGIDTNEQADHNYSSDELQIILNASHLQGELTKEQADILDGAIEFAELTATDIMRSSQDMVSIEINQSFAEIMQVIIAKRYSRYPVFNAEIQQMIGLLHVKDLLMELYQQGKITDLKTLIRPIIKISHELTAIELLKKFRAGTAHFALVYGDHHNLIGFVTLDNLLQMLLGQIRDEFHKTVEDWQQDKNGDILIAGNCSIYTLEKALDIDLPENEQDPNIKTLAGLIAAKTGAVPKVGELVKFNHFSVVIEKMQGVKIILARIKPIKH